MDEFKDQSQNPEENENLGTPAPEEAHPATKARSVDAQQENDNTVENTAESTVENATTEAGSYRFTGAQLQNHETAFNAQQTRPSYTQYTPLHETSFAGEQRSTGAPNLQNQNSSEYSYRPPFDPNPSEPVRKAKKEKKSGLPAGTVALLLVMTVLVSFATGWCGYQASIGFNTNKNGSSTNGVNGDGMSVDGDLVIYKSVAMADADGNELTGALTQSQVYDMVSDSVVEITTDFLTSYGNFQYVTSGAGSGVIISDNGYIITNNHVITSDNVQADKIVVRLTDGTEYEAKVIGTDADSDIALLKIDAESLTFAVVGDSDSLKVGDQVMAVGNPLGELGGTATYGNVSATGREITVDSTEMTLIQIDAAINPGNSGGGLFNMKGELVGIVNAKSTGTGIEGLGFAIPANDAVKVVEELRTHGYVTGKCFVGISLYNVTDAFTAYRYFGSQATGVYVAEVTKGYNDNALQVGDRIIAVDGNEVTSSADVSDAISKHEVGDVLTFTLYRDGKLQEAEVKCYEYVPESAVSFQPEEQ